MKTPVHAFEKQSRSPRLEWTPRASGPFSLLVIGLAAFFYFGTAQSQAAGTVTNCTEEAFRFALTGGGTISFTGNCSLTLTGSVSIAANTSIETGGNVVTLSGSDTNRIFTVSTNVNFSITGLTLRNGRSTNGGALLIGNNATVQLTNCTLSANNAFGANGISGNNGQTNVSGHGSNGGGGTSGASGIGGAIYNLGSLLLINCTLSTNFAIGGDGGDGGNGGNGEFRGGNGGSGAPGGIALGGAIYNLGTLSARDCTFSRNAASGGFGGFGGLGGSAPESGLEGNGAAGSLGSGGAIYSTQLVTLVNCTFSDNQAWGGNSTSGGTFVNGNGMNGSPGANSFGGGLFNTGTAVATNCTFYNNRVTGGDGGDGGNGEFTGGDGGDGGHGTGGSFYSTGLATLVNNTFSHGSAFGGTNGVFGYGVFPDAVNGSPGQARGGNIAREGGTFTIKNTILATNLSGGSGYGTVVDAGYNICADGSLALGGSSFINTDPKLGTFGDNGGVTKTLRPLTASPAINAGNDTAILNLDQRGFARPVGTHTDIGSVETTPPTITAAPGSQTSIVGSNVTFAVSVSGDAPFAYQWRFNVTNISGATASTNSLTSITTNNAGNYSVIVTNDFGSTTSVVATLTVLVPPTITAQPVDLVLLAGGSGSFSVAAIGESPLSYQWQFNGTNISGATAASYPITNAQAINAGSYAVIITNAVGSITSTAKTLKVLISPPLTSVGVVSTNFGFTYQTVIGSTYIIQLKTNLTDAAWTSIATNIGTGSVTNYSVTKSSSGNRFFRLLVQ